MIEFEFHAYDDDREPARMFPKRFMVAVRLPSEKTYGETQWCRDSNSFAAAFWSALSDVIIHATVVKGAA